MCPVPLRKPDIVIPLPVSFHAMKDHVVAVIQISNDATIGLRFPSADYLIVFMAALLEKAVQVWPEDPLIKEYLDEDSNEPKSQS